MTAIDRERPRRLDIDSPRKVIWHRAETLQRQIRAGDMFDLDVGKILVVGTIALIVVGPKDLPRVLRTVGQVVGKIRRMANEVQNQVMDAVKEADLEGVKKEFNAMIEAAKFDVFVDPASAMRGHSPSTVPSSRRLTFISFDTI
jgi:Tat protein translocase TatB subunit